MKKSWMVAAIHAALVLVVWANYQRERASLPRAWARSAPIDPYSFMRGRYINLDLIALAPPLMSKEVSSVRLVASNGLLSVESASCCTRAWQGTGIPPGFVRISPGRAAWFIPENIPDPSLLEKGEVLWVEVTIPKRGTPRPLRLWKGKDGQWPPGVTATPPQN